MNNNDLLKLFIAEYGNSSLPVYTFFAPGRVNLIGEYTDINGGYVFPASISLGIYAAVRLRSDNVICFKSLNAKNKVIINITQTLAYKEEDGWGNYPKGIVYYLLREGFELKGCDILFYGDLPDGAGLSSSASLLVLTAYLFRYINGEREIDKLALASFCQTVENNFIKVNCGIMDQFSVANGKNNSAILLNCKSMKFKYIPFSLEKHSLVIMNTNKKRELTESKYNQRREECEQALAILRNHRPIENLCQASMNEVITYVKNDTLRRRATHVITENQRVLKAVKTLEQGNIDEFGDLMVQSHISLRKDYEVTGLELDCIVENSLKIPGCIGARMTGAGFGGCAIAVVENDSLKNFQTIVSNNYKKQIGLTPYFYVAGISDGVKPLGVV